jgi:hypothetical protein
MGNKFFNENYSSTKRSIRALGLPTHERSRALAALAKVGALVGAFSTVAAFLSRSPQPEVVRAHLKAQ